MGNSRQIVAILFSLLIASSMVVVPASAAFTPNAAASTPASSASSAPNLDLGTTTGASALDHTTPDDLPQVGGQTPRDVDGDGRYEDVTGDGAFTNSDVVHFFGHQHLPPVQNNATYFDYNGDGDVGQADVTTLFDALSADERADVIVPVESGDADEDGSPDRFESNVAGTDPHEANSDSTLTPANESANDDLDSAEDLSGNGVPLIYAAENDLDPLVNDTDGDGLPDGLELLQSELDPTTADSDDDGTPDGESDLDGDGLTNAEEVERNAAIDRADTDGDGLEDGTEVAFGSDPRQSDTDGDGVPDRAEQRLGTDPTEADSDSDGTPDSEEEFTIEHAEETTGATATASGTGVAPSELSITPLQSFHNGTEPSAGPTVSVTNVDQQDSVTVALPVTEDVPEADLSVYTRKPERNATWERVSTEYDTDSGVARTQIAGDRQVTVLDVSAWATGRNTSVSEIEPVSNFSITCKSNCTVEDEALVVGPDVDDDAGEGVQATQLSTQSSRCIEGVTLNCDRDFDGVPNYYDPCPDDALDSCTVYDPDDYDNGSGDDSTGDSDDSTDSDDSGGSDDSGTDDSTSDSGDTDDSDGSDDGPTDSDGDGLDDSEDECPALAGEGENGCPFEGDATAAVYIPTRPDTVTLTTWFDVDGGSSDDVTITVEGPEMSERAEVSAVDIESDLEVAHVDVSEFGGDEITVSISVTGATARVAGFKPFSDHDGDELVTKFESDLPDHPVTGNQLQSDPYDRDSDDDGLKDGEEISSEFDGAKWKLDAVWSDPSTADTDGDGLDDEAELVLGTDPYDSDTDSDGTSDADDVAPLTDAGDQSSSLLDESAEAAAALEAGAGYGETGLEDGWRPSEHRDSPYYVAGWIIGSFVPIADFFSDTRDAAQNVATGDYGEAALDAFGLWQGPGDAAKAVDRIGEWIQLFPSKSDELLDVFVSTSLFKHIPNNQIDDVYRQFGNWNDVERLSEGTSAKKAEELEPDLRKFAKNINADDGPKLRSKLTYKDIERVSYDKNGDPTILVQTNKWKVGAKSKVLVDGPGWKHIVARHVSTNSKHADEFSQTGKGNTFAVKAGEEALAKPGTTMWDKSLSPEQVKDGIMAASRNGANQFDESHGLKKIEWDVPPAKQSKYGADQITVLKVAEDGKLITAFPSGSMAKSADPSDVPN